MCKLTDDPENPGDQDAPEDAAFNVLGKKDGCNQDTDQRKENSNAL